jgi:glutathione S-transferase
MAIERYRAAGSPYCWRVPLGRVPALRDGDQVVFESVAIL